MISRLKTETLAKIVNYQHPLKTLCFFNSYIFIYLSIYLWHSPVDLDVWELKSSVKDENLWITSTDDFFIVMEYSVEPATLFFRMRESL